MQFQVYFIVDLVTADSMHQLSAVKIYLKAFSKGIFSWSEMHLFFRRNYSVEGQSVRLLECNFLALFEDTPGCLSTGMSQQKFEYGLNFLMNNRRNLQPDGGFDPILF